MLDEIPLEIFEIICLYLNGSEIYTLSCVSNSFKYKIHSAFKNLLENYDIKNDNNILKCFTLANFYKHNITIHRVFLDSNYLLVFGRENNNKYIGLIYNLENLNNHIKYISFEINTVIAIIYFTANCIVYKKINSNTPIAITSFIILSIKTDQEYVLDTINNYFNGYCDIAHIENNLCYYYKYIHDLNDWYLFIFDFQLQKKSYNKFKKEIYNSIL